MTSTFTPDAPAPAGDAAGDAAGERWVELTGRAQQLRAQLLQLRGSDADTNTGGDDQVHAARLVTFLAAMEDLTCAVAGAQILATAEFSVIHGTWLAARKRPRDRIASAIGAQVGAARKQSPHRGSTLARTATTLVGNLPHTLAALFDGRITEYRASLIAARAGWLSNDLQRELDQKIAAHLTGAGDARIADLATGIAYRLDPQGAADRVRGAFTDRHVSIRPAPDTMVRLSALCP